MKKNKIRLTTVILIFALLLGALACAFLPTRRASADTFAPTGVFYAGSGGSVTAPEAGEGQTSYVRFSFRNDGVVNYRHDLALKWYEGKGEENAKYFNTEFSFPEINFATFTVTFESAQENITKDNKTTNAVIFTAGTDGVTVAVKNGDDEAQTAVSVDVSATVSLAFLSDEEGEFAVACNGELIGVFKNVGGYFMEYLSSSSATPRIPMAFSATLAGDKEQLVDMISLNGQSFALTDGKITDDTAPVLVINEKLNSFPLAQKFSLSYEAIDVLKDSVTVTRQYYVYGEGEEVDYQTLTTSTYLMPKQEGAEKAYVSIRFLLEDNRSKTGEEEDRYVYLAWYADPVHELDGVDYIELNRNTQGPSFSCVTLDDESKTQTLNEEHEAFLAYGEAVAAQAEKSSAGDGSYFYLPSLRNLISDDQTDYNNLKFSIFYKKQASTTSNSETALGYNALRFEIDEEGDYSFRVIATDKLGNTMKAYVDGKLVNVTSSNVWDIDEIPQFNFSVKSTGATIEAPGEQSKGYLDSVYSISDFDVVALAGYQIDYALYIFDQEKYLEEHNSVMPSYSELVSNSAFYADYLVEIREYDSTVEEGDTAWENTDNDFEWYSSSLTFRPQKAGYYFVKATVTDSVYWQDQVTAYQVIEVSNPVDTLKGESNWLRNNNTTVILLGVSGVLFIALIVVLIIPSERKIEEVELSELKGVKRNGKKK